jgi:hypothetical protein
VSDGVRHAPDGRIYGIYGATVFGMQTVERTLKIALIETIIERDQPSAEGQAALRSILENMALGGVIERLESLTRPCFGVEFEDLKNYTRNRNHVAHQFFVDYVEMVGDVARDEKAETFLRLCHRETVIALHRIEVMARELRLPEHTACTERRDLELMERLNIDPSERIVVRKFRDA